MASLFDIQAVPNQTLSMNLEDNRYVLTLRAANGIMAADVTRNETTILQGHRLVANAPVLPYRYLEAGNFVITSQDDELPDYEKFGLTQQLYYVTIAELAGFRA